MFATNETLSTINGAIGQTVAQYLFALRITRRELGDVLGVTSQSVAPRLYGKAHWTASDLIKTSRFFGVEVEDLLPTQDADGSWQPSPIQLGKAKRPIFSDQALDVVAGARFELTTSGL